MAAVTDFHSHILPGIDDGSASVQESLALLRMEAAQGIRQVVATPHFYPRYDSPSEFLSRRCRAEEGLRRALEKEPGLPELHVGAEVLLCRGISESDVLQKLTIGSSNFVLMEMPEPPWPDALYRELENIRYRQGLVPVVAHIDRYIGPFRTYNIPQNLAQLPVLVQANASFFLRPTTASMARKLLKAGQIHLLGSDCHNTQSRKPNLGLAVQTIRKKLGREAIAKIQTYEQMILGVESCPNERNSEVL